KQRHTAVRIYRRLRDEHGYTGGLTTVKDAVRAWRRSHAEVFVPLAHPPGEAQVDFGEAEVTLDGRPTKVAVFVMTLPYSDAIYSQAFPRECTEAFLEGHARAFAFFGGVPRRISYDNLKIAVAKLTGSRQRKLTDAFLRLASHHLFEPHFCLVRRPNEKGHVETLVGFARRNFLVPVPVLRGGLDGLTGCPLCGSGRLAVAELGVPFGGLKPVEHQVDHCQLDERLRRSDALLPVLAQPPAAPQPGECPLDRPPDRQPHPALGPLGAADDGQVP